MKNGDVIGYCTPSSCKDYCKDDCEMGSGDAIKKTTYGDSSDGCFKPFEKSTVSDQPHYKQGSIEPWDYTIANDLGFCEGNVVKYITRYKYKGTPRKDLEKIKVYVDKILEGLE